MKQNLEMHREVRKKFEPNQNLINKVDRKRFELEQIIDLQKKTMNSPYKKSFSKMKTMKKKLK